MATKKIFLLFSIIFCTFNIFSQEFDNPKVLKKGNIIVSAGYGVPSIIRAFLKLKTTRDQLKVYGYGPFIFKADYMLSSRFSVGINNIYNYTKVSWMQDGYDPITFDKKKYETGIIGNEFSSTIRGNYYFWMHKKINSYAGLGLGYGYVNVKSYTLAPTAPFVIDYDLPSPLRFEGTWGLRYFPTSTLGLYTELGLGKTWILLERYFLPEAIIQVGMSLKF